MIAIFLALLTTLSAPSAQNITVTHKVQPPSTITKTQIKPIAIPLTAHPLAG